MAEAQKKRCFAIAPIGAKDSDIRKRSDKVLKHIFKKALDDKFEVKRGDDIDEPGMITSQVLQAVQEWDLVVADLTGHNPNVLYELAVRHAVEKPVIHVIEPKLSKIPFDIAGFRTIEFDLTDPDSIESAVEQVQKQAAQAMAGKWGETPIKLANIMQRTSGDTPQMLLLKQAVEGIADMKGRFAALESEIFPVGGYGGARSTSLGRAFSVSGGPTIRLSDLLDAQDKLHTGAVSIAKPFAASIARPSDTPQDAGPLEPPQPPKRRVRHVRRRRINPPDSKPTT